MRDKEIDGTLFQEKPLTPEEHASLIEVISWVNESIGREYGSGVVFLKPEQIKVLPQETFPTFSVVYQEDLIHPFLKDMARVRAQEKGYEVRFGVESEAVIPYTTDDIYLTANFFESLQQDRRVGYLRFGVVLINEAFYRSAQIFLLQQGVQKHAERMVTNGYRQLQEVTGLVTDDDLTQAIEFLHKKGAVIRLRGLVREVLVEGKRFIPPMGLPQDAATINYLSKPARRTFASLLCNTFNIPIDQRLRIDKLAELIGIDTNLDEVIRNPGLAREAIVRERKLLAGLHRLGIRGRMSTLNAYLNGEIGRRIVEEP